MLVTQWVFEWITTGHNPVVSEAKPEPKAPPMLLPTASDLDYMRSRQWEKDEIEAIARLQKPDRAVIERDYQLF